MCQSKARLDWSALSWKPQAEGAAEEESDPTYSQKFDEGLAVALEEARLLSANANTADADEPDMVQYKNLCTAIHKVAKAVLPAKGSMAMRERCLSAKTNSLFKKREKMSKKKNSPEEFKAIQSQIKDSCLKDFKDWVDGCVTEMEFANQRGNSKKVFRIVNQLSKSAKPPPKNLTSDSNGTLLKSPEEVAARWEEFLQQKFSSTQRERDRPPMPPLPSVRIPSDSLTREEFNNAVRRMKSNKAAGPDGIPVEVFKHSSEAKEAMFEFLQLVWENEKLPENFAQARFVMLFKNKGSSNDPSKYRCIGLLNHAYKILSLIILSRLMECSGNYLQD